MKKIDLDSDLRGADLRYVDFRGANLMKIDFRGADMRYADLRGALIGKPPNSGELSPNFVEVSLTGAKLDPAPVISNIHRLVYEAASKQFGLCRKPPHWLLFPDIAELVVMLAGNAGKKLENKIGTFSAATLIYMSSDPELDKIPELYATKGSAMRVAFRCLEK